MVGAHGGKVLHLPHDITAPTKPNTTETPLWLWCVSPCAGAVSNSRGAHPTPGSLLVPPYIPVHHTVSGSKCFTHGATGHCAAASWLRGPWTLNLAPLWPERLHVGR